MTGFRANLLANLESDFVQSLSLNVLSELGDKTFLICVLLSMKYNRLFVFAGCMGAMILMTTVAAGVGSVAVNFLPQHVVKGIACVLFLAFGTMSIVSFIRGDDDDEDEEEEVLEEIKSYKQGDQKSAISKVLRPEMVQAFAMTLLGEWGDRSQLATVGLAAARSPLMVAAGGICGQGIAMALAAIGGQQLSHRISERVMSLGGGILFVVFGVSTAFEAVSLLRAA